LLVLLLLCLPAALLLALLIYDLWQRRLPNAWVLAYGLLFLPYAWWRGFSGIAVIHHVVVGVVAFITFFVLFTRHVMGGGDVKLGATVFLWAGPSDAVPVLLIMAITGGMIGIVGYLADFLPRQQLVRPLSSALYGLSAQRGVPYGVGLALGGLFILW